MTEEYAIFEILNQLAKQEVSSYLSKSYVKLRGDSPPSPRGPSASECESGPPSAKKNCPPPLRAKTGEGDKGQIVPLKFF